MGPRFQWTTRQTPGYTWFGPHEYHKFQKSVCIYIYMYTYIIYLPTYLSIYLYLYYAEEFMFICIYYNIINRKSIGVSFAHWLIFALLWGISNSTNFISLHLALQSAKTSTGYMANDPPSGLSPIYIIYIYTCIYINMIVHLYLYYLFHVYMNHNI